MRTPAEIARLISEDINGILCEGIVPIAELAALGDNGQLLAQIISDNALNVDIDVIETRKMPGMYAPGRVFISTKAIGNNGDISDFGLMVLLHELGHAYRDQKVGGIYNIFLLKDFSGNPIDIKTACEMHNDEERYATEWAIEQALQYDVSPKIIGNLRSFQASQSARNYEPMVRTTLSQGFDTVEDLVRYFRSLM